MNVFFGFFFYLFNRCTVYLLHVKFRDSELICGRRLNDAVENTSIKTLSKVAPLTEFASIWFFLYILKFSSTESLDYPCFIIYFFLIMFTILINYIYFQIFI